MWPLTRVEWRSLLRFWRWVVLLGTPATWLLLAAWEWWEDGLGSGEAVAVALAAPLLTIGGAPLLWAREKVLEKPRRWPALLIALALAWGIGVYTLAVLVATSLGSRFGADVGA